HQILLGDAHLDDLLGQRLAKWAELARATRIAGDRQHLAIVARKLEQRLGEHLQIRAARLEPQLCRHAPGGLAVHGRRRRAHDESPTAAIARSISAMARPYSSSLGTPW